MKIRNGFVSNSSSSSFLVVWDKKPESVEEVKNILFGDSKMHVSYDYSIDTLDLSQTIFDDTKEMSEEEIKEEIRNQYSYWSGTWYSKGYKSDEQLLKKYEEDDRKLQEKIDYYSNEINKFDSESIERLKKLRRILRKKEDEELLLKYEEIQKKYKHYQEMSWSDKLSDELLNDSFKKFMKDYDGKYICRYEYSDNDGSKGVVLEHGDVFDNLPNIITSHH